MKSLLFFLGISISTIAFSQTRNTQKTTSPTGDTNLFIRSFSPASATTGDTVTILLVLPVDIASVEFGGVPAASFSFSPFDVIVKAVVGNGASGKIKLSGFCPECATNSDSISGFIFIPPADMIVLLCDSVANTSFTSNLSGNIYQWQISTDSLNYISLSDNNIYTGTSTNSLQLTGISYLQHGNKYRCVVDGKTSRVFILQFENSWIGNSATDWTDPLNWSCGKVPDNTSNVIISHGNVILNDKITINSLTIKPGAHLTINTGAQLTVLH